MSKITIQRMRVEDAMGKNGPYKKVSISDGVRWYTAFDTDNEKWTTNWSEGDTIDANII